MKKGFFNYHILYAHVDAMDVRVIRIIRVTAKRVSSEYLTGTRILNLHLVNTQLTGRWQVMLPF